MTKTAFLFPGQGAQYVGMGKDVYEQSPQARAIFDEADRVLGFSLSKLCFEGPLEELTQTSNCQPAIVTVSIACLKAMQAASPQIKASYVAGLSLGEYAALVAAGILQFKEAIHLVRRRGELMAQAAAQNPGTMSCLLGIDVADVEEICAQTNCEIANLNCPGQVVISGAVGDIQRAAEHATARGAKRAITLDVSGAFHCSFMDTAAVKLRDEIGRVVFNQAVVPVISNVDASAQTEPVAIRENLIRQVNSTTYWEKSMRFLLGQGVELFYEVGPGAVLKGLMKKIDSSVRVVSVGKWTDCQDLVAVPA